MNFHHKISVFLVLGLVWLQNVYTQDVIYFENFESGAQVKVNKIKRYPMNPEIVSADPSYLQAFPPPSGRFAIRAQDKNRSYFGLGSIVAGPSIDLSLPEQQYAAIEAKIYLSPSASSEINNNALIAVDDSGKIEKYYRFGYSNGSVYFHLFNRVNFTESLYDPDMGASLQIPGWHSFAMRFSGQGKVYFYVDGKQPFFSPVEQTEVTSFRMGVLGWDKNSYRPVLADDFKVTLYHDPPTDSVSTPKPQLPSFFSKDSTPNPLPQSVTWYTDPEQALQAAQTSGKKFLILFYLPDHPKTSEIERQIISNPSAQPILQKFVLLKLNGRIHTQMVEKYQIFKFPTSLVIDMQGRVYWEYRDVISPEDLNRSLARF